MTAALLQGIARAPALRPLKRAVRSLQDTVYRAPQPWFTPREVVHGRWSSSAVAASLKADGICVLERLLVGQPLQRAQEVVQAMIDEAGRRPRAPGDTPNALSEEVNLIRQPLLADLLLHPLVLAAVEAYYGKPIFLAQASVQRLNPVEPYEDRSFQWHHDTKGKYVKAMWLLADVPSGGQRMSYAVGSHTMRHRWATYEETRFTEAQARASGAALECCGPAGSVVVFETNGIHRGNRNQGPTRDVLFGVYTAGRDLEGCQFDLQRLGHLERWQQDVLRRSASASRRPARPTP